MQKDTEVLVAGAGPTGLFLALVLTDLGVRVRIVDKTASPGTTSRALAVQARTLEFYRQVGLANEVVSRGLVLKALNFWSAGERRAHVSLAEMGRGLSPFPFGVIFPQDEHERLLIDRLASKGVEVERRTELVGFAIEGNGVVTTLTSSSGALTRCKTRFLAGCDGARSLVRDGIGAGFPGGTYDHLFYVADVSARGEPMNGELHVLLDDAGFLGLFPLEGEGHARLIGTIVERPTHKEPRWEDVDRDVIRRAGIEVERVNWFSTYHVHHRVTDTFRRGPVFLLGDAAHIHSPVGGQGMNTGLGDAMNLGWKLAAVLQGRARDDLLDTYEPERIAFAKRLVATTDRVFQALSSKGAIAGVVRRRLAPSLVERLARNPRGRRLLFRLLSQIAIAYRKSAWSHGRAGKVHAGDRLPWVMPDREGGPDNFTPLSALDWQVHVFHRAEPALEEACRRRRLALFSFDESGAAERAGLRDDAVYLVRPDGYLGAVLVGSKSTPELVDYLDEHAIRTRHSRSNE